jgi:lysyl-tRNA synthetase class 2
LYINGIELANGYHELTDADEQMRRFTADNQQRLQAGEPAREIDAGLMAALERGLPNCAGVALGIDRLLLLV